ncbi:hypothetical protein NQ317_005873 [Molorchus minor]|uniref:Pyridine nucleotide-disulfide oxidoreductase domain-containing protein 1 n=1 Tax=Molorchus minor TaxID=1323400 RepID=A0ABQ9K1D5_9CUCU|nr:hypothetical protein NQ317_005873 [Molorchus minor]
MLNLARNLFPNRLCSRLFTSTAIKKQVINDQPTLEIREVTKDRSQQVPVETSIRYLKSAAYEKTYEGQPVWVPYRRNHKGQFAPRKTRKTCIRQGQIATGNPCPLCRDEYLVLHEENVDLLKQFICPHTGSVLSYNKTGICQKKHQQLLIRVTCAETLAFLEPEKSIILLSESSLIKTVTNLHAITKTLTGFDIKEVDAAEFNAKYSNITIIHNTLTEIDDVEKCIKTKDNQSIKYQYLCLCMGAEPRLIPQANKHPEVLGIRDTDSVENFVEQLKGSKKASNCWKWWYSFELVYKVRNAEVHWVIKDKHIAATFVDPGAAEFFRPSLEKRDDEPSISKRMRYGEDEFNKSGAALGPDWYKNLIISGSNAEGPSSVILHCQAEVATVQSSQNSEYPIEVSLTNGDKIECNLIVSATGVQPKTNYITRNKFIISEDGGIKVNDYMQTNLPNIYAAGDLCTANWPLAKHWFQMKLWTQARQMGCTDYEILLRMTKGMEYIKFVLQNDRLQGAVLIGETDLEEMAENLILNQIDLSPFGDDILNPDIDIEDYFD